MSDLFKSFNADELKKFAELLTDAHEHFIVAERSAHSDAERIRCNNHRYTAAELLGASRVVGLHTEDWEHFAEDAAQFAAAFEGSGLLVPTPRGETVTLAG